MVDRRARGAWGGGRMMALLLAIASFGCEEPVFVDPSKKVIALTDEERAAFCDELAAIAGGYNVSQSLTCDGVVRQIKFVSDANRQECEYRYLNLVKSCWDLTVAQVMSCEREFYAQTCETVSLPSCEVLYECW
jgi:hypothetical protein